MAWLAVDENEQEVIFEYKPLRAKNWWYTELNDFSVNLPQGSIEKLIGKNLTWNDEPIELI